MLHSAYNLNHLGSTSALDLIGHHSGVGGLYDGCNATGNPVANAGNYLNCGIGGLGVVSPPPHNLYSPPLPRRRYSIGGLPSASMTECLHIMQQNAEAAHLSSLLNETKTSITRASQILSRGEDISDDILLSSAAGDLAAQYSRLSGNNANTDITAANILNQLPASNSFSSHPNIYYSQPNYHNHMTMTSHDYLSRFKRPSSYQYSNTSRPFYNSGATSLPHHMTYATPPSSSYFYHTQPSAATTAAAYDTYHMKYYQPPPPYTSLPSSYHTPHHHYRPPMHYTSNPAISQSSNYYFKHNYLNTAASAAATAPISFNNYSNNLTGYSNQHFDLHHYNNCNPKLDLDYTKPNEHAKRQVSFKVDVDTLSIES